MKRKGYLAAGTLLALLALAPASSAQVCSGQLIKFDEGFAWQTLYAPYVQTAGGQLFVVGVVSQFCPPLALDATDPSKEYTLYLYNLTAAANTIVTPLTGRTNYHTDYPTGTFEIWEDTPRDWTYPPLTVPPSPPNGSVPSLFTDGTMILSGTLSNLFYSANVFTNGTFSGSWRSDYTFTGGTLYGVVANTGTGLLGGSWSVNPGQYPSGYSAFVGGKWDQPPTDAKKSTWGSIKSLYR